MPTDKESNFPTNEERRLKWIDVPSTLQEAIDYLDDTLSDEDKAAIRAEPSDTENQYTINGIELPPHFSYYGIGGMGMRNGWGLWQDSPLALWFREHGIWMADDMSGVISTAYYQHLHGDNIDDAWVAKERAYYDAYWSACGVHPESLDDFLQRLYAPKEHEITCECGGSCDCSDEQEMHYYATSYVHEGSPGVVYAADVAEAREVIKLEMPAGHVLGPELSVADRANYSDEIWFYTLTDDLGVVAARKWEERDVI